MQDYTDELRDRDDRVRKFEFEGTNWTLRAFNPYGFWRIEREGKVPECLAGMYTSFVQAEKDIIKYVEVSSKAKDSIAKAKAERIEAAIYKKPRDMSKYKKPKIEAPKEN